MVSVGTPIATIVDLTQTWVYAAVPETYADVDDLVRDVGFRPQTR